ncbi:MAG: polysaccharide pyruvyl transferase family protein [Chloroflexota bacterium]
MSRVDALSIVAIGDIGSFDLYHVGDEAMLDANLTRLRAVIPDVRFTVLSRDPQFSSQLYQCTAILPIGFPSPDETSESVSHERMIQVKRAAERRRAGTLSGTDPLEQVVNAIAEADGVLISGGGNLSSTWTHHLYERAALIDAADILGKPVVMTGQTIGPNLLPAHQQVLEQVLPLVSYLGARELDTFRLALKLGVSPQRLVYQVDDALYMDDEPFDTPDFDTSEAFIAVTIHPFADPASDSPLFAQLAHALEAISEKCGARLVFIPHLQRADDNPQLSDAVVGRKIQSLMRNPETMRLVEVATARKVYGLTKRASMVLSTRYHPLVFGVGSSVPGIGLFTDDYTRIKLSGALEHAELHQWIMPLEVGVVDALVDAALDLWSNREQVTTYLRALQPLWHTLERARLVEICQHFGVTLEESDVSLFAGAAQQAVNPDPQSSWLTAR